MEASALLCFLLPVCRFRFLRSAAPKQGSEGWILHFLTVFCALFLSLVSPSSWQSPPPARPALRTGLAVRADRRPSLVVRRSRFESPSSPLLANAAAFCLLLADLRSTSLSPGISCSPSCVAFASPALRRPVISSKSVAFLSPLSYSLAPTLSHFSAARLRAHGLHVPRRDGARALRRSSSFLSRSFSLSSRGHFPSFLSCCASSATLDQPDLFSVPVNSPRSSLSLSDFHEPPPPPESSEPLRRDAEGRGDAVRRPDNVATDRVDGENPLPRSNVVVARFAPSPTGALHVGGARVAVFNYLFVEKQRRAEEMRKRDERSSSCAEPCGLSPLRASAGAEASESPASSSVPSRLASRLSPRRTRPTFLLRIDDTDEKRSAAHAGVTAAILRDLRWLGIAWDEGPEVGGAVGPYFQSQRAPFYADVGRHLVAEGHLYPCFCTKEDLLRLRHEAVEAGRPPRYDGRCLALSTAERTSRLRAAQERNASFTLRFKVPERLGSLCITDALRGPVEFDPATTVSDFVCFRRVFCDKGDAKERPGGPAAAKSEAHSLEEWRLDLRDPVYNFCTAVDDCAMGVTHVIRGVDHLINTASQVLVLRALGAPVPTYCHGGLLVSADGRSKISKRSLAETAREPSRCAAQSGRPTGEAERDSARQSGGVRRDKAASHPVRVLFSARLERRETAETAATKDASRELPLAHPDAAEEETSWPDEDAAGEKRRSACEGLGHNEGDASEPSPYLVEGLRARGFLPEAVVLCLAGAHDKVTRLSDLAGAISLTSIGASNLVFDRNLLLHVHFRCIRQAVEQDDHSLLLRHFAAALTLALERRRTRQNGLSDETTESLSSKKRDEEDEAPPPEGVRPKGFAEDEAGKPPSDWRRAFGAELLAELFGLGERSSFSRAFDAKGASEAREEREMALRDLLLLASSLLLPQHVHPAAVLESLAQALHSGLEESPRRSPAQDRKEEQTEILRHEREGEERSRRGGLGEEAPGNAAARGTEAHSREARKGLDNCNETDGSCEPAKRREKGEDELEGAERDAYGGTPTQLERERLRARTLPKTLVENFEAFQRLARYLIRPADPGALPEILRVLGEMRAAHDRAESVPLPRTADSPRPPTASHSAHAPSPEARTPVATCMISSPPRSTDAMSLPAPLPQLRDRREAAHRVFANWAARTSAACGIPQKKLFFYLLRFALTGREEGPPLWQLLLLLDFAERAGVVRRAAHSAVSASGEEAKILDSAHACLKADVQTGSQSGATGKACGKPGMPEAGNVVTAPAAEQESTEEIARQIPVNPPSGTRFVGITRKPEEMEEAKSTPAKQNEMYSTEKTRGRDGEGNPEQRNALERQPLSAEMAKGVASCGAREARNEPDAAKCSFEETDGDRNSVSAVSASLPLAFDSLADRLGILSEFVQNLQRRKTPLTEL